MRISTILLLSLFLLLGSATFNIGISQDFETEEMEEDFESDPSGPSFEGSLTFTLLVRQINEEARTNPENVAQELKDNRQTIESTLTVADYLDESQTWRWLAKVYGYQLYETEASDDVDNVRVDELFADWSGDDLFISLGKRRNSWGPALAFNPVNVVVPPRDPLNPDQQTEGQPMLFFSLASDLVELDLIYTRDYDRDWYGQYARWGARFAIVFEESDISVYYFDGEVDENDNPYEKMVGFSFSGNFLSDSTIYLEAASFSENYRNYYDETGRTYNEEETVFKAVLGSNTTIDGNTSLLFEFFHNSGGYTKEERLNYFKAADSVFEPSFDTTKVGMFTDFIFPEMNQNYLLISFRKTDILDQVGFIFQILGAEDGSSVTEFEGEFTISDFYKCSLLLRYNSGDDNSEFGNSPNTSEAEFALSAAF